ncbi:PorV/PorQ family protein [candidate division WOR-3 bacterium]|nr:PorV/PorQ family protein [candidate division WOR-3 bacterium]
MIKKVAQLTALILFSTTWATKYAGDFEELGTSARAIGMGGAVVASASDPSAIYYNPSLPSRLRSRSVLLMHSEDFSGLVKHNFIGVSFPDGCQAFGIAVLHNGIPGIKLTKLPDSTQEPGENNRPYVDKIVNANQIVGYFNYARNLSPYFAIGGNAKIIYQELGGVGSCFGMGVDFGLLVTPLQSVDIGFRVRNVSTSPLFWDTKTREYITPRAAFGISKLFQFGRNRLRLAVEIESDFEERTMFSNFGMEYAFREALFGRIGVYRNNFSFGLGFRFKRFHLDYGYATGTAPESRELGTPQQISGGVEF